VLAAAATMVAAAMVLPLGHLVLRAGEAADPLALVSSSRVVGFVGATLRLAVVVTLLALVAGVGIAWLVERSDLPARRVLGALAVLPLVVPTYVGALAVLAAFGPRGLVADAPVLVGFSGATIALTLSTFPYVLLTTRAALAAADPALEEAARSLGDGPMAAFRGALLPQLRPAVAGGGLLVFLYVLSDFGAVAIMRYDTLTRAIFLDYGSSFDRARPAVLGVLLVGLTLAAIAVERRVRGRAAPQRVVAGRLPAPTVPLGRWRWPAFAGVVAVVLAGVGVPVAVLGSWAVVGSSRGETGPVLVEAASTSVGLSAVAAAVTVALAVPVAVLAVRFPSRFSRGVEALSLAGFALPGLVIALALVFFTARFTPAVYQTYVVVVAAYVIRFLPEALASVRASLTQVDPTLEEAARSLGRGRLAVLRTVTLPLVRGGLLAGAALVFLTAMKELPATLLLRPAGADTLAVRVWTSASEGFYARAAPAALLLVAVSALVLWPLRHSPERRPFP
jgi:iron(III) transport system permease protein